MHTRTVNNFEEYVAFVADHISPNWRGYTKGSGGSVKLEEALGEPKSYPVTVGLEWECGEESGYSMAVIGSVELRPVINKFKA